MGVTNYKFRLEIVAYLAYARHCLAPVAQLDRVSGFEPGGREFESLRAHFLGSFHLKEQSVIHVHIGYGVEDSRAQLRDVLANYLACTPVDVPLQVAGNRPYLSADTGLYFSVSHSQKIWAVAVADAPVGLDLECPRERAYAQEIISRYFSEQEQRWLRKQSDPLIAFYQLWTAKEAYLKYQGIGIAAGLSHVRIDAESAPWHITGLCEKGYSIPCKIEGAVAHLVTKGVCSIHYTMIV